MRTTSPTSILGRREFRECRRQRQRTSSTSWGAASTFALEGVDGELVEAPPLVQDLVAGPDDRFGDLLVERAQLPVGQGGGLLDLDHAPDEGGLVADRRPGDAEVLLGSQSVDP